MVEQQPYIWFQVIDDSDSLATQRFHVRRGTPVSAAHSSAANLRARMGGCSGCAYLIQDYVLPGVELFPPDPLDGSDVRRCGVFVFGTASADQFGIVVVPGLRAELVKVEGRGAGVELRQDDPAVAGLIAELISGRWCNPFGYVLTTLEAAYAQVRDAVFIPRFLQ